MSNKKKPTTSTFYSEPAIVEELYTGYLLKSPAQPALTKSIKSWKRRFFVLSKTGEDYQLTYHANNETKEIDLSKISLLRIGPEAHQKWDWIQKNFKCSPSSVLFLKVEDDTPKHSRDYFLLGENSDDVDGWLNALVKVMKTQKSQNTLQDNRFRSASEPVKSSEPKVEDQPDDRWSAPELMLTYQSPYSHYDYPRKLSEPPVPVALKIPVIEHKDEKDEMQDESAEDSNEYMLACKCTLLIKEKDSCLFHKGDQILAFNDLLIDTVEEIQMYLRRLSKDEVKLTIRRLIGSQPLHSEPCPT
uniref:PH domain-containing protein n=1 Tax=Sinocyclocheilus rhinocerous TaxID=307959 RepID=A0A673IMY1_9TELE